MAAGRTMADALRIGMGFFVLFSAASCAPDEGDHDAEYLFALGQSLEPKWTFCATNQQHCMFSGTREVRYGDGTSWTVKTFTGGVHCSGSAFRVRTRRRFKCEYNAAEPTDDMQTDDMPHEHDIPDASTDMPHDPSMHMPNGMMPYVDESAIPVGDPGTSKVLIQPTSEKAPRSGDDVGAFRNVCRFSHMNFDDPIVFPGKARATHLHAYFGNTLAKASSTAESIRNTGNSTCRGGIANRTAYWVPALLDAKGRPQTPEDSNFYYKSGYSGIEPSDIKTFPQGLRMVAGDAKATGAQEHAFWGCFENYIGHPATIPNCPVGDYLQMIVDFPQCWNGKDLDSADHKSHMAYPEDGACPRTHPVAIPAITFGILYKVPKEGVKGWRLASDMYDASLPGGYSVHGDWFEGWDPAVAKTFVQNCTSKGVDCHSHLLGDGREIFY